MPKNHLLMATFAATRRPARHTPPTLGPTSQGWWRSATRRTAQPTVPGVLPNIHLIHPAHPQEAPGGDTVPVPLHHVPDALPHKESSGGALCPNPRGLQRGHQPHPALTTAPPSPPTSPSEDGIPCPYCPERLPRTAPRGSPPSAPTASTSETNMLRGPAANRTPREWTLAEHSHFLDALERHGPTRTCWPEEEASLHLASSDSLRAVDNEKHCCPN